MNDPDMNDPKINIGSISTSGGNVEITGRDTYKYTSYQVAVVSDERARQAASELRDALGAVALDRPAAGSARDLAREIDTAVHEPETDKSRIARLLEQLTRVLAAAGSLATAGVAVIGPLQTLAGWLGDLAAPVLRLLAGSGIVPLPREKPLDAPCPRGLACLACESRT